MQAVQSWHGCSVMSSGDPGTSLLSSVHCLHPQSPSGPYGPKSASRSLHIAGQTEKEGGLICIHFWLHLIDQNLVIKLYLASRDAGNCSLSAEFIATTNKAMILLLYSRERRQLAILAVQTYVCKSTWHYFYVWYHPYNFATCFFLVQYVLEILACSYI